MRHFFAALIFLLAVLPASAQQIAYVFAPSGLNLRAEPSANGAKLATVPKGSKLEILNLPKTFDMTVDGLNGGMAQVRWEGKEGYMFSGYLAMAPTASGDMEETEKYVERARDAGLTVYHEQIQRDYGGYYQSEYIIVIDNISMQDAFLLAKDLFRIPAKLNYPAAQGKGEVVTKNPDATAEAWTDELTATYDTKGKLSAISYAYRGEGGGKVASVSWNEAQKGIAVSVLYIAD